MAEGYLSMVKDTFPEDVIPCSNFNIIYARISMLAKHVSRQLASIDNSERAGYDDMMYRYKVSCNWGDDVQFWDDLTDAENGASVLVREQKMHDDRSGHKNKRRYEAYVTSEMAMVNPDDALAATADGKINGKVLRYIVYGDKDRLWVNGGVVYTERA